MRRLISLVLATATVILVAGSPASASVKTRWGVTSGRHANAAGQVAVSTPSTGTGVVSATKWMTNSSPMGWDSATGRIMFNRRGTDNLWDGYSSKPDGTDIVCLTCARPVLPGAGTRTHRGVSDVSSDGRYMLVDVERGQHFGAIGQTAAEPGKGTYSDVWLQTADGSQAWPLTDIYHQAGGSVIGTIWPRFDRTGTKVVWTEMYKIQDGAHLLGWWRMKTGNIVWNNGVPSLADVKTYEPQTGRFYESYGFSPDGTSLLFASDLNMTNVLSSQIYSMKLTGGAPTRLSPNVTTAGFMNNYNEFAYYTPDGKHILYARQFASSGGLDLWMMNPDGTGQQRLTYLSEWWNSQYLGAGTIGGIAFDPTNPNRIIVSRTPDSSSKALNAVMITLGSGTMQGTYYSDQDLKTPVFTRTDNPTSGVIYPTAPGAGVGAAFSVRWTGTLQTPAAGAYSFCAYTTSGARLYIDERWSSTSGRPGRASTAAQRT